MKNKLNKRKIICNILVFVSIVVICFSCINTFLNYNKIEEVVEESKYNLMVVAGESIEETIEEVKDLKKEEDKESFNEEISLALGNLEVFYHFTYDGYIYTNIPQGQNFSGNVYYMDLKGIDVALGASEAYQESVASSFGVDTFLLWIILLFCIIFIISMIYSIMIAGREEGESEVKKLSIDNMSLEVNLLLSGFLLSLYIPFIEIFLKAINYESLSIWFLSVLATSVFVLLFASIYILFMSNIRNIKDKVLFKNSLTYKLGSKVLIYTKEKGKVLFEIMSSDYGKYALMILFAYLILSFIAVFIIFIGLNEGEFIIVPGAILYAALNSFVVTRLSVYGKIIEGIEEIKAGNMSYKIEYDDDILFGNLSKSINTMREGMKISIEKEVKSQRMKTELITNVSHDLKTPLTSIINYSKLLCEEDLKPKKANEYAQVILRKSEKLNNLTNDLFNISKVESGEVTGNLENIDVAFLLKQVIAEHDEEIKNSEIVFVLNIPSSSVIVASDGDKISRVFENLLGNAIKYAMKNTRVFISLLVGEMGVRVEFKNIASYHMDFDEEEVVSRFFRGDKARSSEGSGVGLAICESYSKVSNGKFAIKVDGDMFIASVDFLKE